MRYFGMRIPPWTGSQQPSHACDAPARNRRNPAGGSHGRVSLMPLFAANDSGVSPPPVVAVRASLVSASVDGVQNAAAGYP